MKKVAIFPFLFFLLAVPQVTGQTDHLLWFNQPAAYFEECLPLGNGRMGTAVYGGIDSDKIQLNDITLWSGGPVNPYMNPEAYKALPEVREALMQENYRAADSLNKKLQGRFSESYAPLGTLMLHFPSAGEATGYHRSLDIETAMAKVEYSLGDVKFTREYFVSHPDQILVIRLSASKKGALNFSADLASLLVNSVRSEKDLLMMRGYAPLHAAPNYLGRVPDAVKFDPDHGTRFTSIIKVKETDGQVQFTDSNLVVSHATNAVLFVSVATSFNGFDRDPVSEGMPDEALAREKINKSGIFTWDQLLKRHTNDYGTLFNRVKLDLGSTTAPDLPTNERLKRYATGAEDHRLEVLYFQYGRYLLISSSRTPGVPANLQGLWNPYIRPPWSCNYTTNINAEENYWLAEQTNLPEMHESLLGFIGNLAVTGGVTASTFYGCRGWAACHNSDIWAMSNPVGNFGGGDPSWANWNMGGAWLSTHLWEHFQFSADTAYLQNYAYPLMKGAARFCMDWMVKDKEGNWITSPSTSPENRYVTDKGYHGATLYGGTADLAIIRECLEQTLKAANALRVDEDFRTEISTVLRQLHPYKIGAAGNLQEWYYDWKDEDPRHRHQSHLFGLYPGHQITPDGTPDLATACRKTLEIRGDETTGWSKGWRINLWARLQDGNHAYKMVRELLRYVDPDGMRTNYSRGGGTYPNLFDAHPPFQIDGNFGGAAAVIEMLMQSTDTRIMLLPALPDAWPEGKVEGIRTRGGFILSMEWKSKMPVKVKVFSVHGGKTSLVYGNTTREIKLKPGEESIVTFP